MIDRGAQLPPRAAGAGRDRRRRRAQRARARSEAAPSRSTCSALLQKPDPGYANKLLERKAELPRFGQAFLARALALNLGAQHPAVTGAARRRRARRRATGTTALIREPGRQAAVVHERRHAHHGDRHGRVPGPAAVRADVAAAGQRIVRPAAERPLADDAGQPLRPRRAHALREVAAARQRHRLHDAGRPEGARRRLQGQEHAHSPVVGAAGCGEATDGAATIRATGGEVFYSTVLRFRRDVAHQKPYEHEFTVRARVPRPGDGCADRSQERGEGRRHGARARHRVVTRDAQPPGDRRSGSCRARAAEHQAGHERRRPQEGGGPEPR